MKPKQRFAGSLEMRTWTAAELRSFLDYLRDDRLYAAWRLAATTGMRRGECSGCSGATSTSPPAGSPCGRRSQRRAFGEPKTGRGKRSDRLGHAFFEQAQRCYERWDPSTPAGIELLASDAVPAALDEVDDASVFLPAVRRRYEQDVPYSALGYLEVLGTYSGHRALSTAQREGLFACIGDLINRRHAAWSPSAISTSCVLRT